MESTLAVSLGDQEHLKEFFDSMRAAGKKGQAEDIENLLSCIESMQGDLIDALDEVKYLREQIKTMQDKTMQAKLQKAQEEMQEYIHMARKEMGKVKQEVSEQIRNAVYTCKKKGIQVLGSMLDAAHIYEGLSRVELHLNKSVEAMERRIEKADRIADELHGIKGHMKNIGNVAVGKPAGELTERDSSQGMMSKIEKSMEFCKRLIAGMSQKMLRAKAHILHFKRAAESKGEEKVASVQEIMKELREASAMSFTVQPRALEQR